MIELRDYQKQAVAEIYQQYRLGKKRVMLQLATGTGKTSLFSHIVRDFRSRRSDQRVLCVAHRVELIKQMSDRLKLMGVDNHAQYAGGAQNLDHSVHCVSVQTFASNRYQRPDNVRFIVLDEAHHYQNDNSYSKILEAYPEALVLGVTATPIRLDGRGFADTFEALVCGPSVQDLQAGGYLADYKAFAGVTADVSGVGSRGGDYKVGDLADACDAVVLIGNLVENYQTICPEASCIVFAVNVQHSQHIVDRYRAAGISADHIDGKTPKDDRSKILERFKSGETKILSNVGIVSEGFDVPHCQAVQLARPTQSLSLYLQMVGRSLRPHGDKIAIILDHANAIATHGLPCDNRIWTLDGCESDQIETKVDPSTHQIRELTDEEKQEALILEKQAALEEIKRNFRPRVDQIVQLVQQRGWKPKAGYYRMVETMGAELTPEHLRYYCKQLGKHWKWADRLWDEFVETLREPPASWG